MRPLATAEESGKVNSDHKEQNQKKNAGEKQCQAEKLRRLEDNDLVWRRRMKAAELSSQGFPLFPNSFKPGHSIEAVRAAAGALADEELANLGAYTLAGRIMALRSFGKAAFIRLKDHSGRLQCYVEKQIVGEEVFALFRKLDVGDIIGIKGPLFHTRTGELTLKAEHLELVTKSYRPLPEKFHGLTDVEQRYRQRYLDLIMNDHVRSIFVSRSKIISTLRAFLEANGFMEVETPMMQFIPGGAAARPFETYHNALGAKLYLRVAPELYLKRLVVGGLERVYELNRNFRNEGVSIRHNPEFTMLEFYQAYATYEDLLGMTEKMVCACAQAVRGGLSFDYQGRAIDLTPPWRRLDFRRSLVELGGAPPEVLDNQAAAIAFARQLGGAKAEDGMGKALAKIFDILVEPKLWAPTFVTGYPRDISPLSRGNDLEPDVVDRFEFFIAGREMGNGFSELNDPDDQLARFHDQVARREAGDDEAQFMDIDYVRALEYGMPPTAGEGMGIDRLVMLLTDQPSIREVIIFPLLKPEQN
jgi:lysyl-tRNA synthetase class 2